MKSISHIAIIMDGNGRWAKKRFQPRLFGHRQGMRRVVETVEFCTLNQIDNLTLYAFSTENWKRPTEEVNGLMNLLVEYIVNELNRLVKNNVHIEILGDITILPSRVKDKIYEAIESTSKNTGLNLNIAINYGGQDEILHAVNQIIEDPSIEPPIDNSIFQKYLYSQTPVDLLIRPGGEKRLSNFLLYQIAYAEIYFSDVLWPDFTSEHLEKAINWYFSRNRRFGGV